MCLKTELTGWLLSKVVNAYVSVTGTMKVFILNLLQRKHSVLQFALIFLLLCTLASSTRFRSYSFRRGRFFHKKYNKDSYGRIGIIRRIVRKLRSVMSTKDALCNQTIRSTVSLTRLLHNISSSHGHFQPFVFPRRKLLLDIQLQNQNAVSVVQPDLFGQMRCCFNLVFSKLFFIYF